MKQALCDLLWCPLYTYRQLHSQEGWWDPFVINADGPHTSTDPPQNFSTSRKTFGKWRSLRRLHTHMRPSHRVRWKFDSSVKRTDLQCLSCQFFCSWANCRLAALCASVKRGVRTGHLVLRPHLNLFRTFWAETWRSVALLRSFCRSRTVAVWWCKASRVRYLSSCCVVMRLRPCPALLDYWPVSP